LASATSSSLGCPRLLLATLGILFVSLKLLRFQFSVIPLCRCTNGSLLWLLYAGQDFIAVELISLRLGSDCFRSVTQIVGTLPAFG